MFPTLKNNAATDAAGYQGPVKIELLKGAGLSPDRPNFFEKLKRFQIHFLIPFYPVLPSFDVLFMHLNSEMAQW